MADRTVVLSTQGGLVETAIEHANIYQVAGCLSELVVSKNLSGNGFVVTHPKTGYRVCALPGGARRGAWDRRVNEGISELVETYGYNRVTEILMNANQGLVPW